MQTKTKIKHYVLIFISLAMLGVLIYTIEVDVFIDYLFLLEPSIVLRVLLVYCFTWLARAFRLHLMVGSSLGLRDSFRIQIAGFALNLIYPAKLGDIFMGSFLKKKVNIRFQESMAYILHLRVLDFLVLFFLGSLSFAFIPHEKVSPEIWGVILGGGAAVTVLGAVLLFFNRTSLLDFIGGILPKKFDFTHFLRSLARFHRIGRVYFLSYAITLLIWGLEVFTCYVISLQIAPEVAFWAVLSALVFGNIMKALPLFPGGLGTYEAAFILLLTLHGAPYEIAVSLSIIDHLLKKLLNLLVGFPVYLGLQKANRLAQVRQTPVQ